MTHDDDKALCQVCGKLTSNPQWRPDITGLESAGNVCPACLGARRRYLCNGAITEAPSLRAAAHAFASLAAFDAYGEDGMASARYLQMFDSFAERGSWKGATFRAQIGVMDPGGLIRGPVVTLKVEVAP